MLLEIHIRVGMPPEVMLKSEVAVVLEAKFEVAVGSKFKLVVDLELVTVRVETEIVVVV